MKKKLFLLVLFIECLFMVGCDSKREVKSTSDFNDILVKQEFTVSDNMSSYSQLDYISDSKVAEYKDVRIEMIVYTNEEDAKTVYNDQVKTLQSRKSTAASEKNINVGNYSEYILISNNLYMITSRVENTLIFCETSLDNKDIVIKAFEELGYK